MSSDEQGLEQPVVELEHLLAETDPRLALDSCTDAALVAVGPRGRGLLKQLHIGSTTEWLIGAHRPLAPVVVVRSARATKDVVLCTDGSAHARSAIEALLGLPWLAELREHGVDQVTYEVIDAVPRTAEFDVRSVILTTVAERSPDLVALGARGTGGVRGLVVGSVTAAVVHHASCSVLVAKGS